MTSSVDLLCAQMTSSVFVSPPPSMRIPSLVTVVDINSVRVKDDDDTGSLVTVGGTYVCVAYEPGQPFLTVLDCARLLDLPLQLLDRVDQSVNGLLNGDKSKHTIVILGDRHADGAHMLEAALHATSVVPRRMIVVTPRTMANIKSIRDTDAIGRFWNWTRARQFDVRTRARAVSLWATLNSELRWSFTAAYGCYLADDDCELARMFVAGINVARLHGLFDA